MYDLANIFVLAWPYGDCPQVMSGYDYGSNTDIGGRRDRLCGRFKTWNCEHRGSANMVSFHNTVQGTAMTNWWTMPMTGIAFGRGGEGFVVINNETSAMTQTLRSRIYQRAPAANILAGSQLCSGGDITVNSSQVWPPSTWRPSRRRRSISMPSHHKQLQFRTIHIPVFP